MNWCAIAAAAPSRGKDGNNNLPTLKRTSAARKTPQEMLLELHVQRVEIKDGWLLYNDIKKLVAVEAATCSSS